MPFPTRSVHSYFIMPCLGMILVVLPYFSPVLGQASAPIPEFTGQNLFLLGVSNQYQNLEQTIRELELNSPQTYYVIILKSTGEGAHATSEYADRLFDSWRDNSRTHGKRFDTARSVIIVTAIDNRQVSVHVGSALRDQYGLDRKSITEELVQPIFIPLARRGDYSEAITSLLRATNDWIAKKDPRTAAVKQPKNESNVRGSATSTPSGPTALVPRGGQTTPAASRQKRSGALIALLASLLAITLILGVLFWLGRRRTRDTVEGKIKTYRAKAVDMMDRLDALKGRLKRLPSEDPDFKEPMSGETLVLYEQIQGDLGKLWERWLEIMDVLDKASKLAKKDSALGIEKLKQAEVMVSDAKVFEEVETHAQACTAAMDRLNTAHEEAHAAVKSVTDQRAIVKSRLDDIQSAGLPLVPYQAEIERIDRQFTQSSSILTPDPLGARSGLGRAEQWTSDLTNRVESILARNGDGKQVNSALDSLKQKIAGLRKDGLTLEEEGGDPDSLITGAVSALADLEAATRAGDPQAAASHLEIGSKLLSQAHQVVESVIAARAHAEREAVERPRQTQRLRESLRSAEASELELKQDFAPGSWQLVEGNLERGKSLLETFDRKSQEAVAAADPAIQKYLLSARLYGNLATEQQEVMQLFASISEHLGGLRAIRHECERLRRELDDLDRQVGLFFRQNERVIGVQARNSLESAGQARKQIHGELKGSRLDWPSIHGAMSLAVEEYAIARSLAEADLRTYAQLTEEYENTRQEAGRVQSFLASHEEDRPASNQHYHNAEDALNRVERESTSPAGEWARLLEQVRGAAADLALSERLAREDIRLARQAESEMHEAERTIRQARTYFSMGITINTSSSESDLSQADRLYQSQEYEKSIQTAGSAIRQIRESYNIAAQQSFLRQMQIQAEQQRRIAAERSMSSLATGAAIGAASAAATILSEASTAAAEGLADTVAPDIDPDPGREVQDEGSTTSSWSSESTEAGW